MSTLKVGTIQDHANSNNALVINSNGVVTTPNRPAAQVAGLSANITDTGVIKFSVVKIDVTNMYSTTTGNFTVPVAGIYQVTHTVIGAGVAGTGQQAPNTRVRKNGSNIGYGAAHSNLNTAGGSGSNYVGASSTILVQCSANDTLQIYNQNTATDLLASEEHMHCAVHLIG